MLDIKIVKTTAPKEKPVDSPKMSFGKVFSDHMFLMDYNPEQGWHDARVVPYAPFQLDPACVVFHYAQELFMKHLIVEEKLLIKQLLNLLKAQF